MNDDQIWAALGEPQLKLSGQVHWQELDDEHGIRVPVDFRAFIDAYGPGHLNGVVSLRHPARGHERLGPYIQQSIEFPAPVPERHAIPVSYGTTVGHLMPFARDANGVELLFAIEDSPPETWHVCAFAGDTNEFVDFGWGFSEWLIRYLAGDADIDRFVGGCGEPPSFEPESESS